MAIRIRALTVLAIVACFAASGLCAGPTTSPAATRPGPPDAAAEAKARKLVNEVYADALRDARTPEQKAALARQILKDAAETKDDPAGKWVMLGVARELATDACDPATALAAVSALDEYRVDAVNERKEVLFALGRCTGPKFDPKALVGPIAACMADAVKADNFKAAIQLADLAVSVAERTKDQEIVKAARAWAGDVRSVASAIASKKQASEIASAKVQAEQRLSELPPGVAPPPPPVASAESQQSTEHAASSTQPAGPGPVVSKFLYVVADDFVVEIYVNGKRVEDENRHLMGERYGATKERDDVELHAGDWIVFNVVNDRLRWNGAKYFAATGMLDDDHPAFWTDASSGKWSFCDDTANVDSFIAKPTFLASHHVEAIDEHKWDGGDDMMNHSVTDWRGEAVWAPGRARSIWIKYVVGQPKGTPDEESGTPPGGGPKPTSRPTRIFDVP
jgi:hypothetical protein